MGHEEGEKGTHAFGNSVPLEKDGQGPGYEIDGECLPHEAGDGIGRQLQELDAH